jgi:electron transfer flavoprotein-quinone oxidoreductase
VVGAGPAGTSAAIVLAEKGLKVALVERGEFPGSKNVMGGQIYSHSVAEIVPEFWKEAPLERCIVEKRLWFLTKDSKVSLTHKNPKFARPPYNSFTVLRAKFDKWFVGKAIEKGTFYIPETLVEEVVRDQKKRIIGVKTGRSEGNLFAPVVVAADGVNSLLSKGAGLHAELSPQNVALAVKEIIALPPAKIQDLFDVEADQGLTIEIAGQITRGMVGVGFIYTNRNTLSVGVGCILSDWVNYRISPYDLIEEMKNHPVLKPLLAGGQIREYLAHLIPEGGYNAIPPLYADGLLVVGDAAMMVNGLHQEGSNLAMTSGRLAAQTILEAHRRGDFSSSTLSLYKKKLDESYVMQDLKKYRNSYAYLEGNRQLLTTYPEIINEAATEFLTVDGVSKMEKQKKIFRSTLKKRSLFGLLKDAFSAWRAFR